MRKLFAGAFACRRTVTAPISFAPTGENAGTAAVRPRFRLRISRSGCSPRRRSASRPFGSIAPLGVNRSASAKRSVEHDCPPDNATGKTASFPQARALRRGLVASFSSDPKTVSATSAHGRSARLSCPERHIGKPGARLESAEFSRSALRQRRRKRDARSENANPAWRSAGTDAGRAAPAARVLWLPNTPRNERRSSVPGPPSIECRIRRRRSLTRRPSSSDTNLATEIAAQLRCALDRMRSQRSKTEGTLPDRSVTGPAP